MRDAVQMLGLAPLVLSPHSLRHGGPSLDVYQGALDLEGARARGRWLVLNSCKRYAKSATLLRQVAKLSLEQRRASDRFAASLPNSLLARV